MRHTVQPILTENEAALIWIHHIAKPRPKGNGQEASNEEKKYSGLGSSDIQNMCREVITMTDLGGGLFELNFGKRYRRLGIVDEKTGQPIRSFNIKHSPNGITWIAAEGVQANANKQGAKNLEKIGKVAAEIVKNETMTTDQLCVWASTNGVGQNMVGKFAKSLAEDKDQNPRIYTYKRPAPIDPATGKKAAGQQPIVFSTIPPEGYEPESDEPDDTTAPSCQADNPEVDGDRQYMKAEIIYVGMDQLVAKCERCGQESHPLNFEVKAKAGDTVKKACVLLSKACTCPVDDGVIKWFEE